MSAFQYGRGTILANKEYAKGTVPVNKKYAAGTVPACKEYAAVRWVFRWLEKLKLRPTQLG